ncbi:glucosamine-6-phosphate deaminase [Fulvivirga sp. M361]|uniref:glucosamine-6-phosphate deaminase n=1 Tax=Fulvivirga sp. M361 TaxID=2594266 RepID=UPI00117B14F6|nr:glucosamine-6-phosphate deaminase [Fulvivirga sp. M361]TRX61824.1 glucosamine-6-phosphate deaminase [Fulvivirga sp. M361]
MITDISYEEVGFFEETRYEKIHNKIFDNSALASKVIAKEIAQLITEKQKNGETCVLGLATGSSPIKVYEELVKMHKEDGLSFFNVVTFNLDEYYPLNRENAQSYYYFMHQHLFNHIDIPADNINIPDGTTSMDKMEEYCIEYEMKIKSYGGLDFQLLGIGRTGHVGFNEPGSHYNSGTRIITLDYLTRYDATSDFNAIENVPKKAITMGIGTILRAKRVVLLGWGHKKAEIIKKTIEGPITSDVPATFLQQHKNTTFILDNESASELTRCKTPWLVKQCKWDESLKRKAITWLSHEVKKPILKLTDKDYNEQGMSDLLALEGSAYDLNIKMFNGLQRTITGWPGGKPNADDSKRPERANPAKKRVLIFSPHPDDDVISMGGTFLRLVEQGHEVHVAYQTSGNIAVSDDEALKFAEVTQDIAGNNDAVSTYQHIIDLLKKSAGQGKDHEEVRNLKSAIRKYESYAAVRSIGLADEYVHFLNMPFYETGEVKKKPLGSEDIAIVSKIIEDVRPHQIYAAGDLADPHGTHKTCLDAIFESLDNLKENDFMNDCWVWLYRGAWHEWEIHEIEMAIPLSPDEVTKKRNAILFHQSQKDRVMFKGDDSREFWMRAEERNRSTSKLYHFLGLAEYEAIEAFKRYHF